MADFAISSIMTLNDFIYSYTKECIDNIIPSDENKCYSEDPSIDVDAIAGEVGIKEIIYTSFNDRPENIARKYKIKNFQNFLKGYNANHFAFLIEDNGMSIIFVNNRKNTEVQRFSIAHEIEHFISKKAAKQLPNYLPSFLLAEACACIYFGDTYRSDKRSAPKLNDMHSLKTIIEQLPKKSDATKSKSDYLLQLKDYERKKYKKIEIFTWMNLKVVSKIIAKDISFLLNKCVSSKIVLSVLQKHFQQVNNEITVKTALYKTVTEIIEEEIADYFAANLLVPTELLSLWEDKSNLKIARAFGVPVKCIKKRKKYEIKHELNYLTSEYLSRREVNASAPVPMNELTYIVGGRRVHDAGQG